MKKLWFGFVERFCIDLVMQVSQPIDAQQTRVNQHHIWSKNTELPNGPPPVCLTSILHVCLSECLLYVQCMHHPDIITYSALSLSWSGNGWLDGAAEWTGGSLRSIVMDPTNFSRQEIEPKTSSAT